MAEETPHLEPTRNAAGSLAPDYFDRLYAAKSDPWAFATSAYEAAKYTATLAALPRPFYENALELGCSIGVLTERLAARCQRLLAVEVSAAALAQARVRCGDLPQVTFEQRDLSVEFPSGRFELILLSEVGYYFAPRELEKLRQQIAAALAPGGHLLLVHYTGETNYPQTADAVHESFFAAAGAPWKLLKAARPESYRLDLLERNPEG